MSEVQGSAGISAGGARSGRTSPLLIELEGFGVETHPGDGPYRAALHELAASPVRFCLLRDDPEALGEVADLDLLIDAADLSLATAALEGAGFVRKRDRRLRLKWVFVRYASSHFYTVDLHSAFVQGGVVYMDAARALKRRDESRGVPTLLAEDQFLHLLLHNLLGKKELQAKHAIRLGALRRAGLDAARLEDQTRRFGTGPVLHSVLEGFEFEKVASDPAAWQRLRRQARDALLRLPGNQLGAWRHAHADRLRLRRKSVVLALLGPDGTGKTTFADVLEEELRESPLRAGRVYMGTWGHDLLPMRGARRLVPPRVSHASLLAARCGLAVRLTPEESRVLQEARPHPWGLAWAAVRYGTKSVLFHLALGVELGYRYVRHIAFSRRPIVITDRYVYDLEFRQGRTPFTHGAWARRLFYRLFPAPDGILYFHAPYDVVAHRKPQLDREQFEAMDRIFRVLLAPRRPLEIHSDMPPGELVRTFLTRHWQHVLERCNQRA